MVVCRGGSGLGASIGLLLLLLLAARVTQGFHVGVARTAMKLPLSSKTPRAPRPASVRSKLSSSSVVEAPVTSTTTGSKDAGKTQFNWSKQVCTIQNEMIREGNGGAAAWLG